MHILFGKLITVINVAQRPPIKKYDEGITNSVIYKRWGYMKGRCNDKDRRKWYLDKGICVCDEWRNDFLAFYNWSVANGFHEDLELDRIDGNKGYSPDNCRWVTHLVNSKNKHYTYKATIKDNVERKKYQIYFKDHSIGKPRGIAVGYATSSKEEAYNIALELQKIIIDTGTCPSVENHRKNR